jgi:hypothetical protein
MDGTAGERRSVGIDGELLARMERIARDLPGRTVSAGPGAGTALRPRDHRAPVLRIDGVAVDDIVSLYERG